MRKGRTVVHPFLVIIFINRNVRLNAPPYQSASKLVSLYGVRI